MPKRIFLAAPRGRCRLDRSLSAFELEARLWLFGNNRGLSGFQHIILAMPLMRRALDPLGPLLALLALLPDYLCRPALPLIVLHGAGVHVGL